MATGDQVQERTAALMQGIMRRVRAGGGPEGPAVVLDSAALAEVAELWPLIQPADPDRPTPAEVQRQAAAHHAVGWLHFHRFTATKAPAELARALVLLTPLAGTPGAIPGGLRNLIGSSADPEAQAGIGADLMGHAAAASDPTLLDSAIGLLSSAAEADADRTRPSTLSNLSSAYSERFRRVGAVSDLDLAVDIGERAVRRAAAADDPSYAAYLSNLSTALALRAARAGTASDLDRSIDLAEQAVAAAGDDRERRARYLSNLGSHYRQRVERASAAADLIRMVEAGEQAVVASEPGVERAAMLSNLSISLQVRFHYDGDPAGLDRAVDLAEQALTETAAEHPDRAGRLSALAALYRLRFTVGGVMADLDRAVQLGEEACRTTPSQDPALAYHLAELGRGLLERHLHDGRAGDLERGIEHCERAVAVSAPDDPAHAAWLSELGVAFSERYRRDGSVDDLDRAVELAGRALEAIPDEHVNRSGRATNLAVSLVARYRALQDDDDLRRAIGIGEDTVAHTADDDPGLAMFVLNLGIAYREALTTGKHLVDRQALRRLGRRALAARLSSPSDRVAACWVVGDLAHQAGDHRSAVALFATAVGLLPSTVPRVSGRPDQERRIGTYRGLTGDAVAAYCAAGDPVGAVEAAELGRGVLLAAQLDARSDLSDLATAEPTLAARYRQIRDQLDIPPVGSVVSEQAAREQLERRRRWWAEHDRLVERIRRIPAFSRFQLPPRLADLRPALGSGTVVLINVGRTRGDAILVSAEADPVHLPLPELRLAEVEARAVTLVSRTDEPDGQGRDNHDLTDTLTWLWEVAVAPVLDVLPEPSAGGSLPRVWWLPIGPLGLFPFHAAGPPTQKGALDRVVSSSIPTLRALAHTAHRPTTTTRRLLAVAMRHTLGRPDLPSSVREAAQLCDRFRGSLHLVDDQATTGAVLAALPRATWVHLACHAASDPRSPSRGGLYLHDGEIPISRIGRLELVQAELAYLSACSTADSGWQHADESIHAASAFQLAGFRHVIASLWALNDLVAARAAREFYSALLRSPTADFAAVALHDVVRSLRDRWPERPDLWACLIHSGPLPSAP